MAKIYIEPANIRRTLSSEESLAKKLRNLSQNVDDIRAALNYKIAGREQISARLRQMTEDIMKESTRTTTMRNALEQIVTQYEQSEGANQGRSIPANSGTRSGTGGSSGGDGGSNGGQFSLADWIIGSTIINPNPNIFRLLGVDEDGNPVTPYRPGSWLLDAIRVPFPMVGPDAGITSSDLNWSTADWHKYWPGGLPDIGSVVAGAGSAAIGALVGGFIPHNEGSWLGGSIGTSGSIGGIGTSGTLSGSLGGWAYDISKGKISGELYAAKGSAEGNIGALSGSVEGSVGKVEGKGQIGATLYKDGKFTPHLGAEAKAEASALSGEAKTQLGSDQYNVHAKAEGQVLTAEAKAGVNAGVFTSDDETTKFGLQAKAGAEAYVASGKVSGGFSFMGIKIDASVDGHVGAGASAGGEIASTGIEIDLDAALGLGLGLDIKIDWSNFKFGW